MVLQDQDLLGRFLETTPEFKQRSVSFSEVLVVADKVPEEVKRYLLDVVWHNLAKVQAMYRDTLGVDFGRTITKVARAIPVRHDIIHRNGKKKDGTRVHVAATEVEMLISDVKALIEIVEEQGNYSFGFFKSAKYHHRPPLISKSTLDERDNPKELDEGESEKTHFAIKYMRNEAILLLESKAGGVKIGTLTRYLNRHLKKDKKDDRAIICALFLTGQFLDKLKEMGRATLAEVYTTDVVISETFKKAVPMSSQMKEEVILTIKAKRGRSIKETIKSAYKLLNAGDKARITRLKVYGRSEDNDGLLLDTDRLAESDYIEVNLDDNGQVITDSLVPKMISIVKRIQ